MFRSSRSLLKNVPLRSKSWTKRSFQEPSKKNSSHWPAKKRQTPMQDIPTRPLMMKSGLSTGLFGCQTEQILPAASSFPRGGRAGWCPRSEYSLPWSTPACSRVGYLPITYFEKDCAYLYDLVRHLPGRRQVRQGTSSSSGFANHATLIF